MRFNVLAFICTVGCCLISMIIAGTSAGKKNNREWLESLNHPDNSFMVKYMNVVGFGFYFIFGYVLYNLITIEDIITIALTVVVIQLMGLCPFFLHKTRKLKLFFYANFIFLVLLPMLILLLLQSNFVLAILVIIYLLWFVYDLSYWYRLMKLNKQY